MTIKPEELTPEGDTSHEDRLQRELHDKVDAEYEPKICTLCGGDIVVKDEWYEVDGSDRDSQYEAGHDPSCVNYRKEI